MHERHSFSTLSHLTRLAAVKSANNARRIAHNNFARWDVTHHDAARANHALVAHCHARKNNGAASDPHIVADADRASILQARSPDLRFKWVRGGIDLYGRSHLEIISDLDGCAVEEDAVEVDEAI